ncbi:cobyrinate a,c-diamide synthase [Reinekea thalattae]|uniref:Cobyrinate a,c-diamide synthase n=1 Tax=Reinekea thalattae TaxID=2593301 RepID=A0A5C8Z7N6_9GAMM|nr:cobyrinate a,c-diamide synthase [Reinekea thalattae]TXR53657.1 cobyrinate a,c-diamide synthase [Reinekea thalattae]
MASALCPAIFFAAPASGQGKTTMTAAIARLLTRHGKKVRIFKTGPDYLDPQILEQASKNPVVQIDLWMAGEAWCRQQFYLAAQSADIILVEGAMGLFDGSPSSADLAAYFNIPVALIMDVKGMAQTAGAVAAGLARFRDDCKVIGLVANNCASQRHQELIEQTLPDDLPLITTLKRSEEIALPERHLGLVQASEVRDELEQRFEAAADLLDAERLLSWLAELPAIEFFAEPEQVMEPLLAGVKIAVAKDQAFSFIYQSNLALLESLGASVCFFSPLQDSQLPDADALWLPGGYPELHAQALAENKAMKQQIAAFHQQGKPILAECGGFLYCMEQLTDLAGEQFEMLALMPGQGSMRGKRGCQGMQTAVLPEGDVRGHAHHRSRSAQTPEPIGYGKRQRHPAPGEEIYRYGSLTASYLHLFFASNPAAVASLFSNKAAG